MDKKKSVLNVVISIIFKFVLLFFSLLVRRILINCCGNEVNGLNSLFLSIIGFLSVAELGVGTSIVFCMYKPIVEKDNQKVAALYRLYKHLYLLIGLVITICGIGILPFLSYFAKDYQLLSENIYITYIIVLISTILTYFFSAKTSLINAYKNNYITTSINSLGLVFQYLIQIIVLVIFKSFLLYLIARIISVLFQWVLTEIYCRHKYSTLLRIKSKIDDTTKKEVKEKVFAMCLHKIGGVLVNTIDSLIISAFIGVVILGKYSNYVLIMTSMVGIISLVFTPLTSIVGHMCVENNNTQIRKYYNFFYVLNYVMGVLFYLGYFSIIDELITLCFGEGLLLEKTVSMVITINYFIQFMRQSTLLFRDATGTFYQDRFKPLFEGICNLLLSILFVCVLPTEYNVIGVIIATIITNLLICHIVEPYVLFKYRFGESPKKFCIKNYLYIILFVICLFIVSNLMVTVNNLWIQLIVNGLISVGISIVVIIIVFMLEKDFRYYSIKMIVFFISKLKKRDNYRNSD